MRSALKVRDEAPAAHALAPPRGQKGAHVAGRERQQLLHVGQTIDLAGEEGEELGDVAAIGFGRIARRAGARH